MPIKPRNTFAALAMGLTLIATPVYPDGGVGAYLAARHASFHSDFQQGARYYTEALMRDPSNAVLLENALMAFIGLGQIDRAVPVARKMQADGLISQISGMVLAVDMAEKNDYDGVIKLLDDGSSIGPLVDGLTRAWAEMGRGDITAAHAQFDKVSSDENTRVFGLFHKAMALAMVGDFAGADDILAGTADGPLRASVSGVLAHAEILSQLGRNADATELLILVFGPQADPRVMRLRDDLEAGKTLPFTMATSANDGLAEVFFTVAGALINETTADYTLIYNRMAEHLNPNHTQAILQAALLLEDLEQYDLATATYNRVPRDDPSFYAAERGRAETLGKAGKQEAAIEVLEQLAKSHGDLPEVHSSLGDALRRQERFSEASAAYERSLALSEEGSWFTYYARGISYERIDDWPKAEADFQKALEINPDQPQVLNYLGYSLLEKNIRLDEALDMIERAVKARPNDGYITDSLGWALYRLRRFDEAAKFMVRAAELKPVDPIVTDHLGDALWAVGRKREAEFQWHRALSFGPEEEDAIRIRRKLAAGLDVVLQEEGAEPFPVAINER